MVFVAEIVETGEEFLFVDETAVVVEAMANEYESDVEVKNYSTNELINICHPDGSWDDEWDN